MPRRGENIYKRKDGRWEGRVLGPDGKYQYIYARTYREIKDKKKDLQNHLALGETKAPEPAFQAADRFEAWLKGDLSDRVKPSTYESYYRCLTKYVIPFFRETEGGQITERRVEDFVKKISGSESLSDSYKRKIISIFRTALREVMKTSGNREAILRAVALPRAESPAVQAFSVKEQCMIEKATVDSGDARALGILLCFYTGIRLGEICALKWGDIDFEAGTISIAKTVSRVRSFQNGGAKTVLTVGLPKSRRSVRKIPLPKFLLNLSEKLRLYASNENNYVLSGTEVPIDPRSYQKLFKKILISAGVKCRKFHAIRHTFATRALELGVDIKTLSEILGHANVSTTLNIYAHSLFEQKKIAIDKFNEMYIMHAETTSFAVAGSVAATAKVPQQADVQRHGAV